MISVSLIIMAIINILRKVVLVLLKSKLTAYAWLRKQRTHFLIK